MKRKNLDIELLRGFAVAITMVAHFVVIVPEWADWTGYFWLGGGVDLFFAISGFLITGILIRDIDPAKFWATGYQFWRRRFYRLFPAAFFWGAAVVALGSVFNSFGSFGEGNGLLDSWVAALFNLENFYIYACVNQWMGTYNPSPLWPYWSLSLEEQFYLAAPFVLAFVGVRWWLLVACLALAFLQVLTARQFGNLLWFVRTDSLLFGCSIALAWSLWPAIMSRIAALRLSILQSGLAAASVLLIVTARPALSPYFMGFVALSAGSIVLLVSADRQALTGSASMRALAVYVGSRSYSLYLVHQPAYALIKEVSLSAGLPLSSVSAQIGGTIVAVGLSFAVAEFSYLVVENPARQWGAKRAQRRYPRIETEVA
ncbi:acyltransferase [Mesorhizobium sp. B2-4-17]|uniref:acyltransferase family protein n=1 Tax=Mesorhizobium sp. B2-4-17 TaxID=2589932 RepID=UPI0011279277|nr:acyltransferase [Mesorhizobium sp. B2-4-17]TPK73399.1 acyltransferase [Mesorhizobium sp. B2-4-17]